VEWHEPNYFAVRYGGEVTSIGNRPTGLTPKEKENDTEHSYKRTHRAKAVLWAGVECEMMRSSRGANDACERWRAPLLPNFLGAALGLRFPLAPPLHVDVAATYTMFQGTERTIVGPRDIVLLQRGDGHSMTESSRRPPAVAGGMAGWLAYSGSR
jgi:hypothetical protein